MRLRELNIRNFGKFQHRSISLEEGLNLICGRNESGKSTVHTFIRSMLFGMRRQRGRASRNDLYSRYQPWEDPSYYAGELRFDSGGKTFRLSRNFGQGQADSQLICETDGECLSVEAGDLKMLLGGVSENQYDNTVSIGQLKGVTDESLAMELKNYMANYQGTIDGSLDLAAATGRLKEKKREMERQLREEKAGQETQKQLLSSRVEYARQECRQLEASCRTTEEALNQAIFHREISHKDRKRVLKESMEKSGRKWVRVAWILAIISFLMFLSVLLFFKVPSRLIRTGLAISILALFWLVLHEMRHRKQSVLVEEPDEEEERIQKLQWNLEYLQQEISARKTQVENLDQEYQEYCLSCGSESPLQEEVKALDLALETLEDLSGEMQRQVGRGLKDRMSEILSQITGGKYGAVSLDEEMKMGLHSQDQYLPLTQASRGTVEQTYFALRMAAADLLCGEEDLPILLDEVFAMYDDQRLTQVLHWLSRQKRQILLFTCHSREERLLEEEGIPFHKVAL